MLKSYLLLVGLCTCLSKNLVRWLIVIPSQRDLQYFLKSSLQQNDEIQIQIILDSEIQSELQLQGFSPNVILNCSENLLFYHLAVLYAPKFQVLHLSLKVEPSTFLKNTFYIGDNYSQHCQFLKTLLEAIGWDFYFLVETAQFEQKQYVSCLNPPESIQLTGDTTLENMELIIGRMIKPSGKYLIVSNLSQQEQNNIEYSIAISRMWEDGAGLISIGCKGGYLPGTLLIMDETMTDTQNEVEYIIQSFKNSFQCLNLILEDSRGAWGIALQKLQEQGYFRTENLIVKNVLQEGYQKLSIEDILQFKAVYLNGSQMIPKIIPPKIRISMFSTSNDEQEPDTRNVALFQGAFLALEETNQSEDILTNFVLEPHEMGCYVTANTMEINAACFLQYIRQLGQGIIGSYGFNINMTAIEILKQVGLHIPYSSPLMLFDQYSDIQNYPNFFNVLPFFYTYTLQTIRFMRYLGWDKMSVIYDAYWQYIYDQFITSAKQQNATICNPPETHEIRQIFVEETLEKNQDQLEALFDTDCRIIVTLMQTDVKLEIYRYLYEKEHYLNNYTLMSQGGSNFDIFIQRKQDLPWLPLILQGQSSPNIVNWYGNKGHQIKEKLEQIASGFLDPGTCIYYDTMMVYSQAFDFMILRGLDYKNGLETSKAMKLIKFTGCTASIFFSKTRNDRESVIYSLSQIFFNDQEDLELYQTLLYNPDSSIIIQEFERSPVWPLNTKEIPDPTIRFETECGVYKKDIEESDNGLLAFRIALGSLCIIGFIMFVLLSKATFSYVIKDVTKSGFLTSQDIIAHMLPLTDLACFIGLGPSWEDVWQTMNEFQKLIKFNLQSLKDVQNYDYFDSILPIFICIGVWIALVTFKTVEIIRKQPLCYFIDRVNETMLPLLGTLPFQILIIGLITIFRCERGSGQDLADSFSYYDCRMNCWSESHIYLVVSGSISIFLYCITSPIMYLVWQYEQYPVLKINYAQKFIAGRQLVQILYICVWGLLDNRNEGAMGIIQIAILVIYLFIFVIRYNFINYQGLRFIFMIVVCLAILLQIIVTIYHFVQRGGDVFLQTAIGIVAITSLSAFGLKKLYKIQFVLSVGSKNNIYQLFRFLLVNSEFPQSDCQADSASQVELNPRQRYEMDMAED